MVLGAVAALIVGVRQAPKVLSGFAMFEVREVRVQGGRYLTEEMARQAAGIVSHSNLWDPKETWLAGLESHPLVRSATVRRIPPGTLTFEVVERDPVALVPGDVLEPVAGDGTQLPIDLSRVALDLPIVLLSESDSAGALEARVVAQELGRLQGFAPDVFAVTSEARYEGGHVTLRLGDSLTRLRYLPPLSEVRLREAMAAMNDWAARFNQGPPREVDLRFEDQVVVRARS